MQQVKQHLVVKGLRAARQPPPHVVERQGGWRAGSGFSCSAARGLRCSCRRVARRWARGGGSGSARSTEWLRRSPVGRLRPDAIAADGGGGVLASRDRGWGRVAALAKKARVVRQREMEAGGLHCRLGEEQGGGITLDRVVVVSLPEDVTLEQGGGQQSLQQPRWQKGLIPGDGSRDDEGRRGRGRRECVAAHERSTTSVPRD